MSRYPQSSKTSFLVSEVLGDPASELSGLLQRASYLEQLETLLCDLVDPDLAAQFQVAAVRKNRLILITPTASWATRLRMQAPQIISSLQASGVSAIEHIDIRVAPLVQQIKKLRTKRPLSPAAKQALDFMAQLKGDDDKD